MRISGDGEGKLLGILSSWSLEKEGYDEKDGV